MGGKSGLRETIISLIPEHKTYVEPFAGAAWILFGKPTSMVECLNDINGDLVNLWRVIREYPRELMKWLDQQMISEEIFYEYKVRLGYTNSSGPKGIPERPGKVSTNERVFLSAPALDGIPSRPAKMEYPTCRPDVMDLASNGIPFRTGKEYPMGPEGIPMLEAGQDPDKEYHCDIERAGMYYYVLMMSIRAIAGNASRFSNSKERRAGFLKWEMTNWEAVHYRLHAVTILRKDYREVFKTYDDTLTFFYVDPPYMVSTDRAGHYYHEGFTIQDHTDLRDILAECKGSWILSYDDDPRILELYREYHIRPVKVDYGNGSELLISNKVFHEGPYRVLWEPVPDNNGRWDTPHCSYCQSRKVTYAYYRDTIHSQKKKQRTYKHDNGNYICRSCGRAFHWLAAGDGIPQGSCTGNFDVVDHEGIPDQDLNKNIGES
jgi:site-specific DNA-adenine methylase